MANAPPAAPSIVEVMLTASAAAAVDWRGPRAGHAPRRPHPAPIDADGGGVAVADVLWSSVEAIAGE